MPPIKRTQKTASAPQPTRRRIAGHGATPRPVTSTGPAGGDAKSTKRPARKKGKRSPRVRRPSGRALAYGAIVVGLVAGGTGAFLSTDPGTEVNNEAFVDRAATEEVLSAATTSVQRLVAIDHEELDQYHASLDEFLTPNLVEELNKNWPALKSSYEQTKTEVDAEVQEAGVSFLEGNHAEVLLVQNVSMTREGAAAGSTSGTYLVGLEKIDGVWKLSKIPDLPS